MVRIDLELAGLFCPDTSDVFVRREAAQGLEPAGMVAGVDERLKVLPELVVAVVVVALDRGVLDRSVHPLDLAVGPGVVLLGQAMLDAIFFADLIEAVNTVARLRHF